MIIRPWTPMDTLRALVWVEGCPQMALEAGLDDTSPHTVYGMFNNMMLDPNSRVFAVDSRGTLLGYIGVTASIRDGSAQVHVGCDPKRRGLGGLMIRRGIRFVFNELGLNRLIAVVRPGSEVEGIVRRLGFTEPQGTVLVLDRQEC